MLRLSLITTFLLLSTVPASAHFLWVVPEPAGTAARVIVSETLAVDDRVDIAIIGGTVLAWRDPDGHETPLALTRSGLVFTVPIRAVRGVVYGHGDLGVRPSGERAYRLHYYPKTILGDPFAAAPARRAPIEIVPTGTPGALRLQVLVGGTPTAGVDVNVIEPDGAENTVQTGADGLTEPLAARGRFGAWARHWVPVSGTFEGTAFDHTRYYATLVFDTGAGAPASTQAQGGR